MYLFNSLLKTNIVMGVIQTRRYQVSLFHFIESLLRFSKSRYFGSSKANWLLCFLMSSIILAELVGNSSFLQWVQKVMVCDLWLAYLDLFCVSPCLKLHCFVIVITIDGSKKCSCERRLLNFRIRMFLNSAVRKWMQNSGDQLYTVGVCPVEVCV